MKHLFLAMLALLVGASTGCVRYVETYSVTFRSRNGAELAKGDIMLSSPLAVNATFRGWYKVELRHANPASKEIEVFYQLFKGKESGRVDWVVPQNWGSAPSKFDFMPLAIDANIIASASQVARGYWRGRWSYVLFTGVYEGGGIEISRK